MKRIGKTEVANFIAQDILEQLPIGIVGTSDMMDIALINKKMVALFGLNGKSVLGMNIEDVFPKEIKELVERTLQSRSDCELAGFCRGENVLDLNTCVINEAKNPRGIMLIAQCRNGTEIKNSDGASPREQG